MKSLRTIALDRSKNRNKKNEIRAAYLFLTPAVLCLLVFVFFPTFHAFWVSLHKWDSFNPMEFIGLKNYINLVTDIKWNGALGRTFLYTAIYVPALYILALLLALIVKSIPKVTGFFRTSYFLPVVMSSVVTGLIWKLMYDEKSGLINITLKTFGINAVPWLSSVEMALYSTIIVNVWMLMGYYMIIFLAGLQDIPRDYYEAATIDGCNSLKSFWHITLPCLSNTSVFVLVVSVIQSFQAFDQIKLMTNGGPASATRLAVQHIYETSFIQYDMGYAASMSFMLFIIIMIFTFFQLKVLKINKS